MSIIATADTHFTDKPADEYRWRLFDWLLEQTADELIFAGDICDQKDRHGARLVNRLHESMMRLAKQFRLILLKGNHDYIDPKLPFFEFLGSGSHEYPIEFISEPVRGKLSIGSALFAPAGSDWGVGVEDADYLFAHATFNGAKAETGRTLTGVDPQILKDFPGQVFSGDIHVPQRLLGGKIEYIGAPYHVRFGDCFEPRVLYIDNKGRTKDLKFPAPRKHTFHITKPGDLLDERADTGDHVKIRCMLRRAEYVKWGEYREEIRRIAADKHWQLFGTEAVPIGEETKNSSSETSQIIDPDELVAAYVKRQKASDQFLKTGKELLQIADKGK